MTLQLVQSTCFRRFVLTALALAAFIIAAPAGSMAFPEPSIVPRAWQLDFEVKKPQKIAFRDASGNLQWYWYIVYKVTNKTGEELMFIPEIEIAMDNGELIHAGRGVPAIIFDRIKAQERNQLLESPVHVVGRLLLGEDHAKESVIVWPVPPGDINEVRIFVAGLSGETQLVDSIASDGKILFRKSLMMTYSAEGNPMMTRDRTLTKRDEQWIMR